MSRPQCLSLQLCKYKKKKEKKNFTGVRFTEEDDFLKLSHDTNAKSKRELSKLVPSLSMLSVNATLGSHSWTG